MLTTDTGNSVHPSRRPSSPAPLHVLLTRLSPEEAAFFSKLDGELDKVEAFYLAREKEMQARAKVLREQLEELKGHRLLVQVCGFTQDLVSRADMSDDRRRKAVNRGVPRYWLFSMRDSPLNPEEAIRQRGQKDC